MEEVIIIGLDLAKCDCQVHGTMREGNAVCNRRLLPPIYVKPYVKCNKADAADADAICEAALRRHKVG